jgi:hypothetical protein
METHAEKLIQLRRQEQESRGYASSSRWYTGLSNAIGFLSRAETGDDPLDRFRDAWAAIYNLFMMHGVLGDEEFRRFDRWAAEVKEVPGVRHLFNEKSSAAAISLFCERVDKAKNALLKKQGRQELAAWQSSASLSADKACRYFLTMIRDTRNACGHPEFNPASSATKKALAAAADCLIPFAAAAIEATIEHPVEGTTGRTTAYRSFLWPFLKNSDSFFSDYYLERMFPDEELGAFSEDDAKQRLKGIGKELETARGALASANAEQTRLNWCERVLFPAFGVHAHPDVRTPQLPSQ